MDLAKSILVANCFRHFPPVETLEWIEANFPFDGCRSGLGVRRHYLLDWRRLDLTCFRNRAVRDVVLCQPPEVEWAVFVDNDVTIRCVNDLRPWLALDCDIGSCRWPLRGGWISPNEFACDLFFCRVEVFRRIPPPWFRFVYSADGCAIVLNECAYFRDLAIRAGFSIGHAGRCENAMQADWCC